MAAYVQNGAAVGNTLSLLWDNLYVTSGATGAAYANAMVSAPNVAVNTNGGVVTMSTTLGGLQRIDLGAPGITAQCSACLFCPLAR